MEFSLDELSVSLLKKGMPVLEFDCGDSDLNAFLKEDAIPYAEQELAKTYVAFYRNTPVAYVSLCTDAITLTQGEKQGAFGVEKPHNDYPGAKIARLAVASGFRGKGIGSVLVEYAIGRAIEVSESMGCRFVTTDAYPEIAQFYEKCGFVRNLREKGRNVSMRLDLIQFRNAAAL